MLALVSSAGCWTTPVVRATDLPRDPVAADRVEPVRFEQMADFAWDAARAVGIARAGGCFSPVGFDLAMMLLLNGAEGETYETIARGMRIADGSLEKSNLARMATLDAFRLMPEEPVLLATSAWAIQPATFHPSYAEEMHQLYGTKVKKIGSAGVDAVRQVNEWVAVNTKGRITKLFESLSTEDALVLVSTVCLDAPWETPFPDALPGTFLTPSGPREVPTLASTRTLGYVERTGYRAVRVPYRAPGLGMVLILPDEDGNVESVLKSMTGTEWRALLASFKSQEVSLRFPKFSAASDFDLKDALRTLGMGTLLDMVNDFRRMSLEFATRAGVNQAVQKTMIEVDEGGTKAASATGFEVRGSLPPPTTEFHADRPFLYAVTESTTGAVLFVGCLLEPSATASSGIPGARPR